MYIEHVALFNSDNIMKCWLDFEDLSFFSIVWKQGFFSMVWKQGFFCHGVEKKIDKNGKKDPDFSPDFLEILRISQKCPEKMILWSFVGSDFFFVFAGHPRKNIE